MMAGAIRRPLPAAEKLGPEAAKLAFWVDTLGLDSVYDYDPVWARCAELRRRSRPSTRGSMGWGARRSVTNFVYNHVGHFAAAGEATCKSLFMAGVTRRFPQLRFAFLEGGVGWACSLLGRPARPLGEAQPPARTASYDPARAGPRPAGGAVPRVRPAPVQATPAGADRRRAVRGDRIDDEYPRDEFAACGDRTAKRACSSASYRASTSAARPRTR